ncbi:hypothetical protein EDC04DRAFT_1950047 [Pisolithus marmoratus]|nr:hypothetical protein EDC04DRAFT_1950047 [Pisolithus marmoratus]
MRKEAYGNANCIVMARTHPVAQYAYGFRRTQRGSTGSYLRPKFFAIIMTEPFNTARYAVIEQCSAGIRLPVRMNGIVKSASRDPGKPILFLNSWFTSSHRSIGLVLVQVTPPRGLFLATDNF